MIDPPVTIPSGQEDEYECGECGATKLYRDEINEMPDGWYRLEDRALVFVLCSIRCLGTLVETLKSESPS